MVRKLSNAEIAQRYPALYERAQRKQVRKPPPRGVSRGNPWSTAEQAVLRSLWEDGRTLRDISEIMGRSIGAVSGQRVRLGLPPRQT